MLKLLMTTMTSLIGRHEVLFWDNGVLELEEVIDGQEEGHVYERVILDEMEQYRLFLLLEAKFKMREIRP